MAFAFLRDLRDLDTLVLHPDDTEGRFLVDHLRRIGCRAHLEWPIPAQLRTKTDVVFIALQHEVRADIEKFFHSLPSPQPTILAIVSYESPTALQLVLECGALAVVEKPIKPFGLLTNLAIARKIWADTQSLSKEARKYKRRAMGDQHVARAKAILMAKDGRTEDQAHQELRSKAMSQRVSIEMAAQSIISEESKK